MENKNFRKRLIVLTLWSAFLTLVVIAEAVVLVIFGKKLYRVSEGWGRALHIEEMGEVELGEAGMSDAVLDNYIKFLKQSYILFGEYPDCEYYKISDKIARNDFDYSNEFKYIENGDTNFLYRVKDNEKVSKVAIDISEHQSAIDWKKVKAAGVDTAIVRVGYRGYGEAGSLNADTMYAEHIDGANKAKIKTAAYFFSEAVNYDEGVEEAKYALSLIKGHEPSEKIIVIDTEYVYTDDYVRANDIDIEDRTAAVKAFCDTVREAGYTPMIYASYGWFIRNLDLDQLYDIEFWLADYDDVDYMDFPYVISGWQYSPSGSCPGVEGDVDVNVWFR
ncbi:MAG: glycoside hydrolase family 25 protein [Eubacterium sp.]|nr:glycoside hydrolase family 25 protein [Eubacterium sp.]